MLINPLLSSIIWAGDQSAKAINWVDTRNVSKWLSRRGWDPWAVIFRCRASKGFQRQVSFGFTVVNDVKTIFCDGFTNDCEI